MYKLIPLLIFLTISLLIVGCSREENPTQSTPEQFTVIGGHLNTTLTASESPYSIINTIFVDSSSTLNIEPGVKIYFEDSTQIVVHGKLSCIGNSTNQILLTSKNASWKGIQITGTNIQSVFQFVIIENIDVTVPYNTLRDGAVEITNANVVIHNSIFRNNLSNNGGALVVHQSQSIITNCLFINNYAFVFGGALISSSSSNKIINNVFYKNTSYNYAGGLLLLSPVLDSVQNNIFYANTNTTGDPNISFYQTDPSHYVVKYNFLQAGNNPYFVSATDFHLLESSPCINSGNPDSKYNDIDGTRNDQGVFGGPLGNW
jgi:predicted outer membrane repeat protein